MQSRFDKVSLAGLCHSRESGNPNPRWRGWGLTGHDVAGYFHSAVSDALRRLPFVMADQGLDYRFRGNDR